MSGLLGAPRGALVLLFAWVCVFTDCSSVPCFQTPRGAASNWHLPRTKGSHASPFSRGPVNASGRAVKILGRSAHERRVSASANALSMSASSLTIESIRTFFGSSSISSVMNAANNVPPVCYFLYLLAAGVGVPVSEDVMVIFVGTLLSSTEFSTRHKVACVAWCYVGVVLSDLLTYGIGAGFRQGLFNPLRRLLFKDFGDTAAELDTDSPQEGRTTAGGSTDRILSRIRRSGKFVGVAERFALGARGPMTLLCGFTGVPLRGFAAGVALGALFGTVPIQLALGHTLRDRPATVGAIGAALISYYTLGPPILAAVGGATLWLGRNQGGEGGSRGQSDREDDEGRKLEAEAVGL